MARRYTTRASNISTTRGLWKHVAEPGPTFRWGCVLRASKPRRVVLADGTVQFIVESTDRQDLELLHHIRDNDMGVVVESYADVASGWNPKAKRPRYKSALADLEAGKINGIACLAVDRLTRRRDQVRPILNAMQAMGGRLLFVWDEIDTIYDDPEHPTELRLHEAVARAEREAERTSRRYKLVAQHRAQQRKISGGGTRPFGRSLNWLSIVDEEADAIRDAAKRILAGEGVYSICQDWNANGPSPVKAKQWTTQVLSQILMSPHVVARRDYYGDTIELEGVTPILDVPTYERIGAILSEVRPHAPKVQHLLSGIAECGRCERPLRGGRGTSARGSKPQYVCPPKSAGIGSCGRLTIMADPANERVEAKVIEWLSDKANVNNLLALYATGPEDEALTLQIADKNDALVDLSRALKERKIRYREYARLYDETVAERNELQRARAASREAGILLKILAFEDVAAEWATRSLSWKRSVLDLCVKQIIVEPVGKTTGIRVNGQRNGFAFDTADRVTVKFKGDVIG